MLSSPRSTPTPAQAIAQLREVIGEFERHDITLGLETYEQYPIADLVGVVEVPATIIAASAPPVVNLHVKDFAFARAEGMIGFTFGGAPLGEGLLDYDAMVDALRARTGLGGRCRGLAEGARTRLSMRRLSVRA